MAELFPFRGYRYNREKIPQPEQVITQPYDKISPEMRERYLKLHPHNIVRVIKNSNYEEAESFLNQWIRDGILVQEARPCLYPYEQEFEFEGRRIRRMGFVGLVSLIDSDIAVKRHENVLDKPLEDRLRLIRATEANEGLVFMLYSDRQMRVDHMLGQFRQLQEPSVELVDEFQVTHRLWTLFDTRASDAVVATLKNRILYIADGHHRFETSVLFYRECLRKGLRPGAVESFDKRMVAIFNLESPTLKILPTHRALQNVPEEKLKPLLENLVKHFQVEQLSSLEQLEAAMNEPGHRFGLVGRELEEMFLLILRPEVLNDENLMPGLRDPSRRLDVNILHEGILRPLLGIGPEELAGQKFVDYFRSSKELVNRLRVGRYQAGFLLKPTSVHQVREIAEQGERMPQKSTDFYPKLLTGLVIMKMVIDKSRVRKE